MSTRESLPDLRIELDGVELDAASAASLANVSILQRLSLPALCELSFLEPSGGIREAGELLPGTSLRVAIGDDLLFIGELTGVLHRYGPANQREVLVRGYDRLHRLRKRQPVRAHVERTLRGLAEDLVADVGLKVRCDDAGPSWQRLMQWWQSDLELLRELSERCGQYFVLRDDELRFLTLRGLEDEDALELELGQSLLEARCDASSESSCREVAVRGWDPWLAAEQEGGAGSARVGRSVDLDPVPSDLADAGRRTLVDEALQSGAQAGVFAQAELDRAVAREVSVEGVAQGDARLQPGMRVELAGVAAPFEGTYVVSAVTHTIDRASGFRSHFETTPPPPSPPERGAVATLGIVLGVDDPSKLGRIRVSLPSFGGLETDWLEVVTAGAGGDKGLIALPDVGDRVLLLLPRQDPAQGLVLGGLYGSGGPPDAGVRKERIQRYTLVTPRGQRVYLDDENSEIRVETHNGSRVTLAPGLARIRNSGGSFVELTNSLLRVHAETDLEIEAPGRSLVFRGAKVDFQTG